METKARAQYDERPNFPSDLNFEGDKGVTKQSDLKDCDINSIFKKFERNGMLPDLIVKDGRYGDFSSVPDFQEAQNTYLFAKEQFDALHVDIRNRFENNPAKFLEFVHDPKNIDEIDRMGLLTPEASKARKDARIAAAAAETAALAAKAQ